MRRTLAGLVLAVSLVAPPVAAEGPAGGDDGFEGLVAGIGQDEVAGLCGACHSVRLVIQQRLSRDRWSEILDLMVDEHEMPRLLAEEEAVILDYLARFYGSDRACLPGTSTADDTRRDRQAPGTCTGNERPGYRPVRP